MGSRGISRFPDSDECVHMVKSWIRTCDSDHRESECIPNELPLLPRRVLDVGTTETRPENTIQLYETVGKTGLYIALSHCWGSEQTCKTTPENIQEQIKGIGWASLPKTFQDAVVTTRALGIRYLWIDSLCIIQGDTNDWEMQSKNMAKIYQDSYLTIAAAVASNDSEGFIKERPEKFLPKHIRIDHVANPVIEPLLGRAWCYQERLVPRRVLTYHHAEVTFECRSSHWCECGNNETYTGTPDRLDYERKLFRKSTTEDELVHYWYYKILRDYTALLLSLERDRLPALSAIASQISRRTGSRCVAGIWEKECYFRYGLTWRCFGKVIRNKEEDQPEVKFPLAKRETERSAPSWSWASIEGQVDYNGVVPDGTVTFSAEVVDLQYPIPEYQPSYIIAPDAVLTLRGKLMDLLVKISDHLRFRRSEEPAQPHCIPIINFPPARDDLALPLYEIYIGGFQPYISRCSTCMWPHETVVFWPDAQLIPRSNKDTNEVYLHKCGHLTKAFLGATVKAQCLFLYGDRRRWGGLVLQKHRTKDGMYERLGLMEIYDTHGSFETIENLDTAEVKVV